MYLIYVDGVQISKELNILECFKLFGSVCDLLKYNNLKKDVYILDCITGEIITE